MAGKRKKKKKNTGTGFISRLIDYFTAALILAIVGGIIYYWFFKDSGGDTGEQISELYENTKDKVSEAVSEFNKGDEKEKDLSVPEDTVIIDKEVKEKIKTVKEDDIVPEDDLNTQFEELIVENIETENTSGSVSEDIRERQKTDPVTTFEKHVDFFAEQYKGLALKEGADPDTDFATDNSHLICSIIGNSAELSGKYFAGYMPMETIRRNIYPIKRDEIRTGDMLVLKSGMIGLITHFRSSDEFNLTYASQNKGSVIMIDMTKMKYYWLKSENFKGFYRFSSDVLK